ncbi:phosphonate C-P lyase system protein PhnH [Salinicoccus bachuensis]|uniref:Phosphonate C-P lyase system protein PhnH n=1 Tax=Salinicoccus bachuensis TaxID=3136731 RepID=A0ABZ3CM64_9STAP
MTTLVHETQRHYRELVDLFSRPGEVRRSKFDTPNFTSYSDAVLATVLTLFDNEIFFNTADRKDADEFLTLTGGQHTKDFGKSDFIVVKAEELNAGLMEGARIGTLASPEKSTTFIIEVASIGEGHAYILQGPGIKTANTLEMTLDPEWIVWRNTLCSEFPLGVDLVIIDRTDRMAVIPRTTTVEVM